MRQMTCRAGECFGGAGFDAVRVGSYVGSQPKPSPNGTGLTVPTKSYFVVNVHYNFLTNREANHLGVEVWATKQPRARSALQKHRRGDALRAWLRCTFDRQQMRRLQNPQYRLEKAYRNLGISISRSTLCGLFHRGAAE